MVDYGDPFQARCNSNHRTSRSCSRLLYVHPLISLDLVTFPQKTAPLAKLNGAVMGRKKEAMTRKRHTDEQIIVALKDPQADVSVQDFCRKHGISDATFYTCWWGAGLPHSRSALCRTAVAGNRDPGQRTGMLRDCVGYVGRPARGTG